jgi:hypothetical protein
MMRHFFQTFASPMDQGWLRAFSESFDRFEPDKASEIAVATLGVVQSMRATRRSGFWYSNPDCPNCSRTLSDDERQLMQLFCATRLGRRSDMHTHAMLLCEGNETSALLRAMAYLTGLLASKSELSAEAADMDIVN